MISRLCPPVGKRIQKCWVSVGSGRLEMEEMPIEWPGPGELLVRVRTAGLCGSDLAQINESSVAPMQQSSVLGLEIAGEIVAMGSGEEIFEEGDRVCCMLEGGGFSEFCCCPALLCFPIPNSISWPEAAAIPAGIMTGIMRLSMTVPWLDCC
jgi:NADPH:quinone reductase-like Zn-dependent oxidoreductase